MLLERCSLAGWDRCTLSTVLGSLRRPAMLLCLVCVRLSVPLLVARECENNSLGGKDCPFRRQTDPYTVLLLLLL